MHCPEKISRHSAVSQPQAPHAVRLKLRKSRTRIADSLELPARQEVAESQRPTTPTAEDVYRDYGARVYNAAWRMLGNHADAEDVCQEVLLQVVRRLSSFRGEALLFTWLYRVTVNAVLALRRKRAIRRECRLFDPVQAGQGEGQPLLCRAATPPEQVLNRELQDLIGAAIAQLPPVYRGTYVLADVQGLANPAVGKLLNLSLPAVKSRLHRARRLMRQILASQLEEECCRPAASVPFKV
jgi:RNA polymerase sigma-70 factor (ECF subfamily)